MQSYRHGILIVSVVLTLSVTAALLVTRGQGLRLSNSSIQNGSAKEGHYPIVDYTSAKLANREEQKARRAKSERFSKRHLVPRPEEAPNLEILPLIDHSLSRLPALPAQMSDAVLLGEIIDAQAYLSNDKTGVYSEFKLQIKQVLKQDSLGSLYPNLIVTTTREGGAVRYPSGRIQRFSILNQGLPQPGGNYVLFLKRNGQELGFDILTGYELYRGQVSPLDGSEQTGLPFSAYKGVDETSFLNAVRYAISQSPRTVLTEKVRTNE
ncbi:MAG TPA: hypothetical protein VF735_05805 [Pyrinomonadaceae bacterium]|jgi:hypothetical protein